MKIEASKSENLRYENVSHDITRRAIEFDELLHRSYECIVKGQITGVLNILRLIRRESTVQKFGSNIHLDPKKLQTLLNTFVERSETVLLSALEDDLPRVSQALALSNCMLVLGSLCSEFTDLPLPMHIVELVWRVPSLVLQSCRKGMAERPHKALFAPVGQYLFDLASCAASVPFLTTPTVFPEIEETLLQCVLADPVSGARCAHALFELLNSRGGISENIVVQISSEICATYAQPKTKTTRVMIPSIPRLEAPQSILGVLYIFIGALQAAGGVRDVSEIGDKRGELQSAIAGAAERVIEGSRAKGGHRGLCLFADDLFGLVGHPLFPVCRAVAKELSRVAVTSLGSANPGVASTILAKLAPLSLPGPGLPPLPAAGGEGLFSCRACGRELPKAHAHPRTGATLCLLCSILQAARHFRTEAEEKAPPNEFRLGFTPEAFLLLHALLLAELEGAAPLSARSAFASLPCAFADAPIATELLEAFKNEASPTRFVEALNSAHGIQPPLPRVPLSYSSFLRYAAPAIFQVQALGRALFALAARASSTVKARVYRDLKLFVHEIPPRIAALGARRGLLDPSPLVRDAALDLATSVFEGSFGDSAPLVLPMLPALLKDDSAAVRRRAARFAESLLLAHPIHPLLLSVASALVVDGAEAGLFVPSVRTANALAEDAEQTDLCARILVGLVSCTDNVDQMIEEAEAAVSKIEGNASDSSLGPVSACFALARILASFPTSQPSIIDALWNVALPQEQRQQLRGGAALGDTSLLETSKTRFASITSTACSIMESLVKRGLSCDGEVAAFTIMSAELSTIANAFPPSVGDLFARVCRLTGPALPALPDNLSTLRRAFQCVLGDSHTAMDTDVDAECGRSMEAFNEFLPNLGAILLTSDVPAVEEAVKVLGAATEALEEAKLFTLEFTARIYAESAPLREGPFSQATFTQATARALFLLSCLLRDIDYSAPEMRQIRAFLNEAEGINAGVPDFSETLPTVGAQIVSIIDAATGGARAWAMRALQNIGERDASFITGDAARFAESDPKLWLPGIAQVLERLSEKGREEGRVALITRTRETSARTHKDDPELIRASSAKMITNDHIDAFLALVQHPEQAMREVALRAIRTIGRDGLALPPQVFPFVFGACADPELGDAAFALAAFFLGKWPSECVSALTPGFDILAASAFRHDGSVREVDAALPRQLLALVVQSADTVANKRKREVAYGVSLLRSLRLLFLVTHFSRPDAPNPATVLCPHLARDLEAFPPALRSVPTPADPAWGLQFLAALLLLSPFSNRATVIAILDKLAAVSSEAEALTASLVAAEKGAEPTASRGSCMALFVSALAVLLERAVAQIYNISDTTRREGDITFRHEKAGAAVRQVFVLGTVASALGRGNDAVASELITFFHAVVEKGKELPVSAALLKRLKEKSVVIQAAAAMPGRKRQARRGAPQAKH
eukprot:gnl/Chilomastix_cuspidata/4627.p1 GENE.gnl/Chilomastix_cuspidata/4627~~gnl/Chilomastix_cuspidata/4627.p1  ORF type:complete len:1489 (-),score=587.32 gnl/Chilomastix_cuspidata/4627:4-4344(-)